MDSTFTHPNTSPTSRPTWVAAAKLPGVGQVRLGADVVPELAVSADLGHDAGGRDDRVESVCLWAHRELDGREQRREPVLTRGWGGGVGVRPRCVPLA